MKDLREELVDALQSRFTGLNGVKVAYDVCNPYSPHTNDLGEGFIVNHVTRTFDTMSFENLVQFFEHESVQYLANLHNSGVKVTDMLVLFREVPAIEKWNKVRYISIVRKKS